MHLEIFVFHGHWLFVCGFSVKSGMSLKFWLFFVDLFFGYDIMHPAFFCSMDAIFLVLLTQDLGLNWVTFKCNRNLMNNKLTGSIPQSLNNIVSPTGTLQQL
jgi:hypothetical protein